MKNTSAFSTQSSFGVRREIEKKKEGSKEEDRQGVEVKQSIDSFFVGAQQTAGSKFVTDNSNYIRHF